MAESGGPTTQSGIYYQNTISALYLGSLLDLRARQNGNSRVISVRIEAPEEIDDTVVTYSDGAVLYIQAKEQFALQGEVWNKFWLAARRQNEKCRSDRDQFRLVLGTIGGALESLKETLERAQGKENVKEWRNSLNKRQISIADSILSSLGLSGEDAYIIIKRTRAEFITFDMVESMHVQDWMPQASESPVALLSHLRDCCGGAGRIRHTFRAAELSELLLNKFDVRIFGSHGDGLEQYRDSISLQLGHIGVPGTSLSALEDDVLVWPTITLTDNGMKANFEDEDPWVVIRYAGDEVDLKNFPSPELQAVILESGAGHGKSTILRATVRRLASKTTLIPALIHAEALPEHPTIQDYLNVEYNARYETSIDWTALCAQGRAVMVIDGVDEISDGTRAALISMIERAAARFPDLPFLVGARDASVTTFPPNFKLIRVQRLDQEQMIDMLKSYFRARGGFNVEMVVRHVLAYHELESLCQIPLFLAIFAATLQKNGVIPASRAEILELYLKNALSPEKHKGVRKTKVGKTQLRRGAEAIASLALTRNEAAVPETKVRLRLSEVLGESVGDDCVDTLLRYGLIECRGSRLAFCIPTIQEYLAGCALAEAGKLDAADLLENVYRRPWAQAIQYAVEKIDNAENIIRQLIECEDDLFYTSLRLAARCVINGANVGSVIKDSIASRLGRAWAKGGHRTNRHIGNLIADGFSKPLHPEIRQALVESNGHYFERAVILERVSDKTLTLECLISILGMDDIRELWGRNWTCLIESIVEDAIVVLLDRVRRGSGNYCINVISEVIYNLRCNPSVNWVAISDDDTLPTIVRLAAKFSLPENSGGVQPHLIDLALTEVNDGYLWPSFPAAYLSTSWWRAHLRERYRLSPTSDVVDPLAYLGTDDGIPKDLVEFIPEIVSDPLTDPQYRIELQILLGALGVKGFSEAATDALATATVREICNWAHESPYFDDSMRKRGVEIIFSRKLSNKEKVEIIGALGYSLKLKSAGPRERLLGGGPFLRRKNQDEAMALLVSEAEILMSSDTLDESEKMDIEIICARNGSRKANCKIVLDIEGYLDSVDVIDDEGWEWLASAINVIRENDFELDARVLWKILEKGCAFPMYSIVSLIIAKEGAECYAKLIDFVVRNPNSKVGHALYDYFERSAEREGLKVKFREGRFQIEKI
ncbi:NACHT domain-containing protein [Burkholderia cenocepacia]|uniref:NACHT domain-containing protein n=1 Tax=Burkholderia cenocepacia TaxID=95486 RepID=UPI00158CB687|nr:hypothetical protein [Burkholderia cenocepacia]